MLGQVLALLFFGPTVVALGLRFAPVVLMLACVTACLCTLCLTIGTMNVALWNWIAPVGYSSCHGPDAWCGHVWAVCFLVLPIVEIALVAFAASLVSSRMARQDSESAEAETPAFDVHIPVIRPVTLWLVDKAGDDTSDTLC